MDNEPHIIPGAAVRGIATGMIMMSVFTMIWAAIAYQGLVGSNYWLLLFIFPVLSIVFVINAIKLFRISKYFPKLTSEADLAEEKRVGKWFGIIFGAEGLGIFIAINVVISLGHPELTIPAMALVIGLHFYPMAKIFKRTIDYYLATWSTIIAILAFVFTLNKTFDQSETFAFVGVGLAIATSCYGIYMMLSGWKVSKLVTI
jgi:hypothetical protein